MNAKISVLVICAEEIIYICYYIICMTVPLKKVAKYLWKQIFRVFNFSEYNQDHLMCIKNPYLLYLMYKLKIT